MNKPITKAQVREFKNNKTFFKGKEVSWFSTGKFLNRRQRRSLRNAKA